MDKQQYELFANEIHELCKRFQIDTLLCVSVKDDVVIPGMIVINGQSDFLWDQFLRIKQELEADSGGPERALRLIFPNR